MISPGCLRVRSPETQRMTQRAPGGQVGTPQGSGSKDKKSCSQAFVGPTKAEGISPVQISPPESMGMRVCLSVCVPCLYLSVCTHYLWTCTFPKIHHPLPHLFFQVPLMGLLALGALTTPPKLWVEYRSPHDGLACLSHDVPFTSGPSGLPTGWGVWGSSQGLARVRSESSLCRPSPGPRAISTPLPASWATLGLLSWQRSGVPPSPLVSATFTTVGVGAGLADESFCQLPPLAPHQCGPHTDYTWSRSLYSRVKKLEPRYENFTYHVCPQAKAGASRPWFPHLTPRARSRINEVK